MLITYNDDQQGYPHPDHLRVHDISVLAFDRAGDPDWYPELGEPWQPLKLYYTVWSRARMLAVHEALLRLRGASPFDEKWFDRPVQDDRITTRIDVGDYLWARTGVAAGPRHAGRPERGVLVRALRRGAGRGRTRGRTGSSPSRWSGGPPRASSRTTCSPASASGCP